MNSLLAPHRLHFSSPQATARFAEKLAPLLGAGDVLLLEGPVGSGKTHFARSLIQSRLPVPEDVPSPTFTIVQIYELGDLDIWHCDLYRLTSPEEAVELGLEDAFDTALCLVEWPDRLADLAPADALTLCFSTDADLGARTVVFHASHPKWAPLMERLNG